MSDKELAKLQAELAELMVDFGIYPENRLETSLRIAVITRQIAEAEVERDAIRNKLENN